jgi:CRP-like cAMP-binding protein
MKPLIAIGALLVGAAAAAGGVTYFLASGPSSSLQGEEQAVTPNMPALASPGQGGELADLRDELRRLGTTVSQLQVEVAALRAATLREPLAADPEPGEEPLVTAALDPVRLEQQVLDVLAAEERRKEEQAELERIEREKQMAMRQAERIAERLSLAPSDQTLLANHLISAQDKRRQVMDQMRDSGFDRNAMRTTFEELNAWNTTELTRIFGPDIGGQIAEQTGNMGGRGGFGGGGRGGGGRGGG